MFGARQIGHDHSRRNRQYGPMPLDAEQSSCDVRRNELRFALASRGGESGFRTL
ncbi:hypothetical protein PUNSTDRAFT_55536 [Punctularia strigosozonata HHB-11173 SS5]|uniref:Uncharacterized protein n=1 Tax=Punctularia strigosozonata (strain HHB-11173) TaxID=741275 RepID=R7S3Z6_PUNST|nr:uncharacterized protein PUNSTDRAFT_55536 [Punctularia strigosozonata HHB-11173 SS5]EIN04522.1 hypothetical protein PUNSTDRAFT_55536 [Punctularia strigosozonata HHB-11173 SS5]